MSYGTCNKCGCTYDNACVNILVGPCWWVDDSKELCSHCYIEEIAKSPLTAHPHTSNPVSPDPQREVECARCGDIHKWSDRLEVKEGIWTVYRCPVCGDESYINCRTILPEDNDLPF